MHVRASLVRLVALVKPPIPHLHVKAGKEGRHITFSFTTDRAAEKCVKSLITHNYNVSYYYK